MRAVVYRGPGEVSVETVPDSRIEDPRDAIVQIAAAGVCGSDLWTYRGQASVQPGVRIGHEFLGEVTEVGADVTTLKPGDWVVAPFRFSDGTCEFCRAGLQSSCEHGGFWSREVVDAGQGEQARVPFADGTLVKLTPDGSAPGRHALPDLLTLCDVMPTGMHAVINAGVGEGDTVVVIGDGAVGQCAVLAARLLGAERIIVLGSSHPDRRALALAGGASDYVSARGAEAVDAVRDATAGRLSEHVVECVGTAGSFDTALKVVRPGGSVGYVGMPHGVLLDLSTVFGRNISISGGVCPARKYIPDLLPRVWSHEIHPGAVITSRLPLEKAPEGYRQMDQRETIKVMLTTSFAVNLE